MTSPGLATPCAFSATKELLVAAGAEVSGPDELMARETRSLVGLKHVISEGVLLGHLKISEAARLTRLHY